MLVQKSIEKCSCEQSERIWERFLEFLNNNTEQL
jgi:hypothetical protein